MRAESPLNVELPQRYALHPTEPVLGEGGMGKVYRAHDVEMDVPVALKVVRPDLAADVRFRKLFEAEVRVAARFTHEHIVPLHDLGELADGTPFLGLALADSGSFSKLRRDATWDDLLRLTLELLDALGHLHSRGVLHRDLKPENVLLHRGKDALTHVWLADLGLAKASTDLARRKGRMEGTPGYMAPEQRLGLPRELGPWTDLFSVGVMLWKTVTGKLPFGNDRSPLDAELPPLVPRDGLRVPEGLELVLANLLAGEPLSRYDLVADLVTELRALGGPTLGHAEAMRGVREGLSGARTGTVAVSAPRPTPPASSLSDGSESASQPAPTTATWFPRDADDPEDDALPSAPLWNRPLPPPLPATPPPESGKGGSARASLPLFALRELPLIARDAHRSLLWEEAVGVARARRPRVVVIVGEAGAGKTHLVESVVRALEEGGWAEPLLLEWQRPPGSDDGYAGAARGLFKPWNETRRTLEARLARWIARERGALDEAAREEASLLARWCGLLGDGEEPVAAGVGLRGVYRHLEARAWRGLSVLVLDNVQGAVEEGDGLSIAEAVAHGAGEDGERPLLVLATVRAEDLADDPDLADRVRALETAGARRVDLPRLNRAGTEALLHESLTLTPALSDLLAARCEGNPLFARQLLLEWANRGWLRDAGGLRFGLVDGVDPHTAVPADAEALFRARVDALAEASGNAAAFRDAVHLIALAGQSVPRRVFDALAGPELEATLRASRLWAEVDERLRFDHGLLHQALRAEAAARPDARALHERLARAWLAIAKGTGEDHALEIGRHAHAAGSWALAVEHLLAAAESAWGRGRTRELAEAAALAVDACNHDARVRWRAGWARLWLGRVAQLQGDSQAAAEAYFQAHQIFANTEDDPGRVQALSGMGWAALNGGDFARADRRYKEALSLAQALGDPRAEVRVIRGLARLEQQKRNFEGAEILFTRAMARSARSDDPRGVAAGLLGRAFVASRTGRRDEAVELFGEAEEAAREANDLFALAQARYGLGVARWQGRQLAEAGTLLREARTQAEELGATHLHLQCASALADVLRSSGEADRAAQIYEQQLRQARRLRSLEDMVLARLKLAQVALGRRDLAGMIHHARQAQSYLEPVPGHWLWASVRLVGAAFHAMRGDGEKAWRWVWSAQELGIDDIVDPDVAFLLTVICNRARQEGWAQALRVAGPLAMSQWERLGRSKQRDRIERTMREGLATPTPGPRREG